MVRALMMTPRLPGAVAMAIRPIGMAAIGRMTIPAIAIAIRWFIISATSEATAKRQQKQQH